MEILYFQGVRPLGRGGGQMLRLPRKPKRINRRRTSADLYEGAPSAAAATQNEPGAPSAAPATQNEPEGLQVLRLPRKMSRMGPKCCACHANRSGAQCNQSSPDFRGPLYMKVLQVLRLQRKTSQRCSNFLHIWN